MQDGTYAHKVLEALFNGQPPETVDEWALRSSPLAPASHRALNKALRVWQERYTSRRPWDLVLATEERLQLLRPWGTLDGTPDVAAVAFGKLWHVQHKRIGQTINVQTFCKLVEVSLHEAAYAAMLQLRYPDHEYGGTMLNIVRHLSEKRVDEEPEQALFLTFLPHRQELVRLALNDIDRRAYAIAAEQERQEPYRNRAACCGPYRNSPCEYYDVCWKGVDIHDDSQYIDVDPRERYQGVEGSKSDDQ